jgi:chaperonin GroEL
MIEGNKTQVLRDLVKMSEQTINNLEGKARKVTGDNLRDIATISSNNDEELGEIISKVYTEVGENGIVTVDKSQTSDTYYETTSGIKVDRGYSSAIFVNDQKRDECVLEDTYVLVSDAEIQNILNIENVLRPIIREGDKLVIIAPCSNNVLNTLAANVVKSNLNVCVIQPPSFGYKQNELMRDIAISVNATYFSEKTGDDLSLITVDDLGHASKIIAGKDSTIIIKDEELNKEEIDERVGQLWDAHKNAIKKADKEFILSRIASLTGGIGVIYAGGNTDLEQKELFDRIDDAVCAVRSAIEEGIVPGGGVALYQEMKNCKEGVAGDMLMAALRAPLRQIWDNAGMLEEMEGSTVEMNELLAINDYGLNIKTMEWGDMYEMCVIDPLKVTKNALRNAV